MTLINKRVNSGLFTLVFVFIILRVSVSPVISFIISSSK